MSWNCGWIRCPIVGLVKKVWEELGKSIQKLQRAMLMLFPRKYYHIDDGSDVSQPTSGNKIINFKKSDEVWFTFAIPDILTQTRITKSKKYRYSTAYQKSRFSTCFLHNQQLTLSRESTFHNHNTLCHVPTHSFHPLYSLRSLRARTDLWVC